VSIANVLHRCESLPALVALVQGDAGVARALVRLCVEQRAELECARIARSAFALQQQRCEALRAELNAIKASIGLPAGCTTEALNELKARMGLPSDCGLDVLKMAFQLEKHRGNVTAAARSMGVKRTTLRYRMNNRGLSGLTRGRTNRASKEQG
jgi:DNA-binding NtrC family response regulator